jgi:hypothetical protein
VQGQARKAIIQVMLGCKGVMQAWLEAGLGCHMVTLPIREGMEKDSKQPCSAVMYSAVTLCSYWGRSYYLSWWLALHATNLGELC